MSKINGISVTRVKNKFHFCGSFKVRCRGHLHTIEFKNGRLQLKNHNSENFKSEKSLITLGGKPPRCFEVIGLWKNLSKLSYFSRYTLPRQLACITDIRRNIRKNRQNLKGYKTWYGNTYRSTINAIKKIYNQCKYRKTNARHGKHNSYFDIGPKIFVNGFARKEYIRYVVTTSSVSKRTYTRNTPQSHHQIIVNWDWYKNVYKKGFGLIGNHFILQILSYDIKTMRPTQVIAIRQGRGTNIHPCVAKVIHDKFLMFDRTMPLTNECDITNKLYASYFVKGCKYFERPGIEPEKQISLINGTTYR